MKAACRGVEVKECHEWTALFLANKCLAFTLPTYRKEEKNRVAIVYVISVEKVSANVSAFRKLEERLYYR